MFFFFVVRGWKCANHSAITQIKTEQVQTIHILPQLVPRMENERALMRGRWLYDCDVILR